MHLSDQAHEREAPGTISHLRARIAVLPGPGSRLRRFDSRFPIRPRDGSPWKIRCGKRSISVKTTPAVRDRARRCTAIQWIARVVMRTAIVEKEGFLLRLPQPDRHRRRSLS